MKQIIWIGVVFIVGFAAMRLAIASNEIWLTVHIFIIELLLVALIMFLCHRHKVKNGGNKHDGLFANPPAATHTTRWDKPPTGDGTPDSLGKPGEPISGDGGQIPEQ